MPKRRTDDQALLDSLSGHLVSAIAMFPKRLVRVDELVHTFHMPLSHIQVLALVAKKDLSIGQLSVLLGVAKPNITPLVDALTARGLVERVRDDTDRRIVMVHILPEGCACIGEIQQQIQDQLKQWPEQITHTEMKHLNSALATRTQVMSMMEDAAVKDA